MKKIQLLLCFLFVTQLFFGQKMPAYTIYNANGKKVSYKKMLKNVKNSEYIFFGEYHDNPIAHWMELNILTELITVHGNKVQLGMEMFESDQQLLLNDYIDGLISETAFTDSCRLWPNYSTDYKPLLLEAQRNQIFVLASNIPRKYASLVYKNGREILATLPENEKALMTPLDFVIDTTLSQYQLVNEMGLHMEGGHFLEAQAIKDATMAYFISKYKKDENVMFHINGSFHSDFGQSIIWFVKQKDPTAAVVTISTVSQVDCSKLEAENKGKGDFIICVPENMTRTH